MDLPKVIVSADDFGLSIAVNEAVELAHRDGILQSASLMVGGAAAADAIQRAKNLPQLKVGLHLVLIDGPAILAHGKIPDLVDAQKQFSAEQVRRGFSYFFRPRVRRQLALEIEAQFAAFTATGLTLDHADAHKHMHLHPTIGRLMIDIGRRHGLRAIRIPAEPPRILAACGETPGPGAKILHAWTCLLRNQARRAGLAVNDHAFGIGWSGHMTRDRVARLLDNLPPGISEIYFHPASTRDALIARLMPDYEHEAELATLLDPAIAAQIASLHPTTFGALTTA